MVVSYHASRKFPSKKPPLASIKASTLMGEPIRRSGRNQRAPAEVDPVPASVQDPTQLPATAGKRKNAKNSKKRNQPPNKPEETSIEQGTVSIKRPLKLRYFCPVSGCTFSRSQARSLKEHYNTEHEDLNDKEGWNSKLAKTIPHLEWLAGKKRLGTSTTLKKNGRPLRQSGARRVSRGDQVSRAAGTPDGIDIAITAGEEEVPKQSQAPADGIPVATTTVAVNREDSSGPPPPKRRKLDDLLERQKDQLQTFIEQELKAAKKRADNAEAKLQKITAEIEAHMARNKERMQKMEEKITKMEKEIQEEEVFGSSTRLKKDYLHQAKIAAKLNPSRPEHGGFVY